MKIFTYKYTKKENKFFPKQSLLGNKDKVYCFSSLESAEKHAMKRAKGSIDEVTLLEGEINTLSFVSVANADSRYLTIIPGSETYWTTESANINDLQEKKHINLKAQNNELVLELSEEEKSTKETSSCCWDMS